MGLIDSLTSTITKFSMIIPEEYKLIIILLFFTAIIVIYSLFIFSFYKFLARKNVIRLNLSKYNYSANPRSTKFFGFLFYILEYIIILPIVTFFWFAVLAFFLLVLSKTEDVKTVLIIAGALIAAVRVTAYVSEDLSRDLAKMLPFALLGWFLIEPNFFSINLLIGRFNQIPSFLTSIPYFLIFIIVLEIIMRIADFIGMLFNGFKDSPYHDSFYGSQTPQEKQEQPQEILVSQ